jgi:prevent-host-death family protein
MATRSDVVKAEESETGVTASEVQDTLGDIMDRAFGGERFRVTRFGRDRAYIIGAADYERLRKLERQAGANSAAA